MKAWDRVEKSRARLVADGMLTSRTDLNDTGQGKETEQENVASLSQRKREAWRPCAAGRSQDVGRESCSH